MCGFIGIYGPDGTDCALEIYEGLLAVQHRGQDAAGIVTFTDSFHVKKGLGLVRDVFNEKNMPRLRGHIGVGHVRYPTVGLGTDEDVQPFHMVFPNGIAMAHNGNVTNFHELKRTYFGDRKITLGSNCDLEVVLYVFADALMRRKSDRVGLEDIEAGVAEVFERVKGAYSVVGITQDGMYAFRDPYGIKPCILGKRESPEGTFYAVASESVVLDVAGYEIVRDLAAGEMLWIGEDRVPHFRQVGKAPHRPCIFEYVYFARPDTFLDGVSVHEARMEMGRRMAKRFKETGLQADSVIPVPESARSAAQTMAEGLGLPCREGFVKNRYIGRTFIAPNQRLRALGVRMKLNPLRQAIAGKRLVVVDDSIVRGTTTKAMVQMLREAGAAEVHLRVSSPPYRWPCFYGMDTGTRGELLAANLEVSEIAEYLGVDSMSYLGLDRLVTATGAVGAGFCDACLTGDYPVEIPAELRSAAALDPIDKETSTSVVLERRADPALPATEAAARHPRSSN